MGCFDFFRFDNDFKFKNHKGDIVIIPSGEYQTKDLKSLLDKLVINEKFEIQRPIWQSIEHKEFPELDVRRWETKRIGYSKEEYTGKINIYNYDLENSKNDKIFDLWVEEGKIYKVEEVK